MDRQKSEKDKELADNARLVRAWRRWHAEQLQEALTGIHADVMRRLMAQLKDLHSARALIDHVANEDWSSSTTTRGRSRCVKSTPRSPRCVSTRT